jgi:hypothetical protein
MRIPDPTFRKSKGEGPDLKNLEHGPGAALHDPEDQTAPMVCAKYAKKP